MCQLLLGHAKIESTVRYIGIELDDALEISESFDIWYIVKAVNERIGDTQLTNSMRNRTLS